MEEFIKSIVSDVGISDVIDILIVAFVIYELLNLIKQTRAEQLVKGVMLLIIAMFLSDFFNLYTIHWILKGAVALGAIAFLILFQPELRRALEYMGRSKFIKAPFSPMEKDKSKQIVGQIVKIIDKFSNDRVGALIVFEQETSLMDIAETGTIINSEISDQIIENIFYVGAPLHDGAMIIRREKIYAAGCVLPLTSNNTISRDLGTRHRAGLGISENSDAYVIIVSEETGGISIAKEGKLTRFLDIKIIEKNLLNMYLSKEQFDGGWASINRSIKKARKGKEDAK